MSHPTNTIYEESMAEWQQEPITFSQQNWLLHYLNKGASKQYISDTDKLHEQLGNLTKGQASEALSLIKQFKKSEAMLMLVELGIDAITFKKEDYANR